LTSIPFSSFEPKPSTLLSPKRVQPRHRRAGAGRQVGQILLGDLALGYRLLHVRIVAQHPVGVAEVLDEGRAECSADEAGDRVRVIAAVAAPAPMLGAELPNIEPTP
jgi:hypothetical protein